MPDILQALQRVRPGRKFTPPANGGNASQPGDVIKQPFTTTAGAETVFRFSANGAGAGLPATFVSIKSTGRVHVVFGPTGSLTSAPNDGDYLLEAGDSWQDFQLNNGDASFRIVGDSVSGGTGDFYLLISGR